MTSDQITALRAQIEHIDQLQQKVPSQSPWGEYAAAGVNAGAQARKGLNSRMSSFEAWEKAAKELVNFYLSVSGFEIDEEHKPRKGGSEALLATAAEHARAWSDAVKYTPGHGPSDESLYAEVRNKEKRGVQAVRDFLKLSIQAVEDRPDSLEVDAAVDAPVMERTLEAVGLEVSYR